MSRRWLAAVAFVLTAVTTVTADPAAEAVREKVRVAVGYDAFRKLEHGVGIVMKDKSSPNVTSSCFLHPDGRFALTDARFGTARGFDGRSAWQRVFNGPPLPNDLRAGDTTRLLGGLLTYKWLSPESGYVVDLDPAESRPYRPCVRVRTPGGDAGFGRVYLDPAAWIPIKLTVLQDKTETVVEVSDYRDVYGARLFSRFEGDRYLGGSETVPESVAVNPPGSNPFSPPRPADDTRFDPAVPKAVEARAVKGLLVVRPSINDKPGPWLLVSTGTAVTLLIRSTADQLGLARVAFTAQGQAHLRPVERFMLGPATISGLKAGEIPDGALDGYTSLTGVVAGGIIGADVLARCVMEGDWVAGTVSVHDPATYFPAPATVWEPAWFDGAVPHIAAAVERRHQGLFRVLTGINYTLHLHPAAVRSFGLLEGRQVEPYQLLTDKGTVVCWAGAVDEFRMFQQRIRQVPTRFDADVSGAERQYPRVLGELNPGLVGNAVVVLDYPGRRIGLRRHP